MFKYEKKKNLIYNSMNILYVKELKNTRLI